MLKDGIGNVAFVRTATPVVMVALASLPLSLPCPVAPAAPPSEPSNRLAPTYGRAPACGLALTGGPVGSRARPLAAAPSCALLQISSLGYTTHGTMSGPRHFTPDPVPSAVRSQPRRLVMGQVWYCHISVFHRLEFPPNPPAQGGGNVLGLGLRIYAAQLFWRGFGGI